MVRLIGAGSCQHGGDRESFPGFWRTGMIDAALVGAFGRRVRLGMVGGGADSVIGRTHLIAMRADGICELVAGAMSIDPTIAKASARREFLAPDRIYVD